MTSKAEQHAIEAYAFYKSTTFLLWTDQPMDLINYVAKKQAVYAIEEAQGYCMDRCLDLSEDEDLDPHMVLAKHDGYQYYCEVLEYLDKINTETGEFI